MTASVKIDDDGEVDMNGDMIFVLHSFARNKMTKSC